MKSAFTDVFRVVVGLYISLVILWFVFKVGNKLPGAGGFFQAAQKLATPAS